MLSAIFILVLEMLSLVKQCHCLDLLIDYSASPPCMRSEHSLIVSWSISHDFPAVCGRALHTPLFCKTRTDAVISASDHLPGPLPTLAGCGGWLRSLTMVGPQTLRRVASAWSPMIAITSDYLVTDNVQADTLGLVFSSVRDVLFSQRAPQTKLQVPLQSVSLEGRTVAEIDDDIETTNASRVEPFDPSFTRRVIAAAGPNANPRVRKVMASLVLHLHDFCRENEITADEYLRGVELVSDAYLALALALLFAVIAVFCADQSPQ